MLPKVKETLIGLLEDGSLKNYENQGTLDFSLEHLDADGKNNSKRMRCESCFIHFASKTTRNVEKVSICEHYINS